MTGKLLRTYYRMAASEPTSPLSLVIHTFVPFTLNQHFGTLTVSEGCSPLETEVYPLPLFPDFYDIKTFGVGQGGEKFPSLLSKSVALPF